MFPIDANDAYRNDDGSLTRMGDVVGGGNLPVASANTLGGVKIGEGLNVTEEGIISVPGGSMKYSDDSPENPITPVQGPATITLENDALVTVYSESTSSYDFKINNTTVYRGGSSRTPGLFLCKKDDVIQMVTNETYPKMVISYLTRN